ncbi:protein kinase domain-containing protein [Aliterella atlantica]|uniref:Serine/threonine protein kinase n=1 Tax=Aliterella atlantica CENA595 TaxID=1618023 RepID=A0A0D8ZSM2_9CYAN|nr:protein kinase [Aliterella atlantica]KJH71509.1 serine/threonine protein kinase [Aliterella atlantica CENA595]
MVTLSLLHPHQNNALKQWKFEDESVIRIGRSPDNDVILTEPLVSRHHLELRQISSDSWQLSNQGTNGTFLDGILVSQSLITDGALLQLAKGGPILKFQLDATPQPVANLNSSSYCQHTGNPPGNLFCIHCGQPLTVQRTVRQYQILRTLGQGGMGTTYLAWDEVGIISGMPQLLVLKEMNADMAKVAKAQELFEREARTLKTLHHSGIPKYYDFFLEAGKKYLAMELIHGQDLEKLINDKGPVTPAQAIAWAIQTCDVLTYIHNQQPPLIHRDIKPANLMVRTADRQIVVLDFGAVKEIGTFAGTRIGAEGYCAPEQERGQPVTQSDLYAIGPTLIFLLTGETPFKFFRQRGRGYRFNIESIPTITPELREVIDRATEPLPGDRYSSAKELAKALATCL